MPKILDSVSGRLITPAGIAVLLVHWSVVAFAYMGDYPEPGFNKGTYLFFYLSLINILPLMLTNLVNIILGPLLSHSVWLIVYNTILISLISIQWLLAGLGVQIIVNEHFDWEKRFCGLPSLVENPEQP